MSQNIDWTTLKYSTDEKVVGTWIDGKTIYERTLTGTVSLTANNLTRVTAMVGVDHVITSGGWWRTYTDQCGSFGSNWGNSIFSSVGIRAIDGVQTAELRFQTTTNISSTYEVFLRYTKV